MVLTSNRLYLAGTPDKMPPGDAWAAYENRMGGVLCVVSREDAQKVAQYELDSAPVYNGLAASANRLFMSTRDGHVICMGGENLEEER